MALSGTVFLDRGNSKRANTALEKAAEVIKRDRQSVFMFPEGTRSYAPGPTMGNFKRGAFRLAILAGVPILPVVCANYHGVLSSKERRFRRGRIPVKVLQPIETKGLKMDAADALCERVRELMVKELVELTESPLGQKATLADPSQAEVDLATLVQERTAPSRAGASAVASGVDRCHVRGYKYSFL